MIVHDGGIGQPPARLFVYASFREIIIKLLNMKWLDFIHAEVPQGGNHPAEQLLIFNDGFRGKLLLAMLIHPHIGKGCQLHGAVGSRPTLDPLLKKHSLPV